MVPSLEIVAYPQVEFNGVCVWSPRAFFKQVTRSERISDTAGEAFCIAYSTYFSPPQGQAVLGKFMA
jgi:hypothetical protein